MSEQNGEPIREYTPEELAVIYAKFRTQFTAEDLIGYIDDIEDTVPAEQVLAEMEAIVREAKSSRKPPT